MALPFTVSNICGGFADCFGLVRDEGEYLVFEFQTKDSFFGIKGKTREVRVPLADLAAVRLERGWFGRCKLVLQAERLESVHLLPGADSGRVELTIARGDRPTAEAFIAQLHQ
jgi:hypothetical protein